MSFTGRSLLSAARSLGRARGGSLCKVMTLLALLIQFHSRSGPPVSHCSKFANDFPHQLAVPRHLSTQAPHASKQPRAEAKPKPIILSGIQPTGQPHLGNYLGAISNWVALQEQAHLDNETLLFMVVDLHAITLPQNPDQLRKERRELAITLLACGIDPKKCILFEQSKVSAHAELAWILNCMTPVGWLARMTQWKSKLGVTKGVSSLEDVSATAGLQLGLFAYPVLMAADVLLYKATKIPVGEDQIQHLELTRDIAQMFNKNAKKQFFPLPQPLINSPEAISAKIKGAVTDGIRGISYDRVERPAVANLVDIYAAMKRVSVEDVVQEHATSSNAVFKEALTDVLVTSLRPIQEEIARLEQEDAYIKSVLAQGAARASEIARPNLQEIHRLMGLN
ncbi:hypothetical protein BGZ70_002874 [Mortierella alpina]|uniref:tryptophan--tRNA ligase n=1 Tax=Mortierella alpina TaxID=64518 RepID=A0A9P6JB44_MORAP|nr:hypothetical protein BGZ70_002874 [Mortierella alpina]